MKFHIRILFFVFLYISTIFAQQPPGVTINAIRSSNSTWHVGSDRVNQDGLKRIASLNLNLPSLGIDQKTKENVIKLTLGLGEIGEVGMSGQRTATHLGIFHNFWSNTAESFTGERLWYHGAAFGSTFILAASGADRKVQDYFQKDPVGSAYGEGAFYLGVVLQPIVGGVLYFIPDAEIKTAGSAVLQATLVQFAYTTLLKGLTGRPDPIENGDPANKQSGTCGNSSDSKAFFQFGKGCTWPSGHTASAVSLISSLYAFYPEKTWIAYVGYPIALAIGLGMVESDEHWLSDVVAGAIMGHIIGWTIGKSFRKDFDELNNPQSSRQVQRHFFSPLISPGGIGIAYQFKF
ncbi:MAG: phosphatase PAP2 family protein [Bacteroidetes bacterium]|nr:phosphatase PAP2 family protein [Bacteroidota bacterium]